MSNLNQHYYIVSLPNLLGTFIESGLQTLLLSKPNNPNYSSFPLVLSHTLFLRLSSNAPALGFYEESSGVCTLLIPQLPSCLCPQVSEKSTYSWLSQNFDCPISPHLHFYLVQVHV